MNDRIYYQTFTLLNQLESETGINECKVHGVYYWRLIRFDVHRRLMAAIERPKDSESALGPKLGKTRLSFWKYLKGFAFSPFFKFSHCQNLIIEHPRKVNLGECFVDPYTHHLVEELKGLKQSYRSLEKAARGHIAPLGNKRLQYKGFDFLLYKGFKRILYQLRRQSFGFPEDVLKKLSEIEKRILEATGIAIRLRKTEDKTIVNYLITYSYFKLFLQRVRPERLYIVVSYGLYAEIQAARDLGIEVIEVQHGLVSNLHAGYSFPNWRVVPYRPDKILSFGQAWFENVNMPGIQVTVRGFSWLNNRLRNFKIEVKRKNTVLVLSQWIITEMLCEWVITLAKLLPEFEITYKVHPLEDPSFAKNALKNCSNVLVSEADLYPCLASAEWAVGVSSTALFEAVAFNCNIAIADLLSAEQFEQIAKSNNVPYCATPLQMAKAIRQGRSNIMDASRWFYDSRVPILR